MAAKWKRKLEVVVTWQEEPTRGEQEGLIPVKITRGGLPPHNLAPPRNLERYFKGGRGVYVSLRRESLHDFL